MDKMPPPPPPHISVCIRHTQVLSLYSTEMDAFIPIVTWSTYVYSTLLYSTLSTYIPTYLHSTVLYFRPEHIAYLYYIFYILLAVYKTIYTCMLYIL